MKTYTVLLLYPSNLQNDEGDDTYMASTQAESVKDAQLNIQELAAEDHGVDPTTFTVLMVIEGEHNDIKEV